MSNSDDWYNAAMAHQENNQNAYEIRNHYYVLELDIMAQDGSTRREHTTFCHIMELDFKNLGREALHHHIHELFTKYKRNHEVLMQVEIEREFWR